MCSDCDVNSICVCFVWSVVSLLAGRDPHHHHRSAFADELFVMRKAWPLRLVRENYFMVVGCVAVVVSIVCVCVCVVGSAKSALAGLCLHHYRLWDWPFGSAFADELLAFFEAPFVVIADALLYHHVL